MKKSSDVHEKKCYNTLVILDKRRHKYAVLIKKTHLFDAFDMAGIRPHNLQAIHFFYQ